MKQSGPVHFDIALYFDFLKNVVFMFERRARLFKDSVIT